MAFASLIILFWAMMVIYWAISAIGVKKNVTAERPWWRFFWVRVVVIIIAVWFINEVVPESFWHGYRDWPVLSQPLAQALGVILCAAGIAFAIWARRHLGRNWSGTPRMKEGHELVTSGPYRFVRHPIYTGIIMAMLGSAIVGGPGWLVAFVIFSVVFIFRVPKEEGFMMTLFPDQYPEYKKRTKALIPFVW